MRKTKIIATLGPASSSATMVEKLIQAGANVFRLNFSHGSPAQHLALAALIRTTAARLDTHIGILVDLQGPKIRIASFAAGSIRLQAGESFVLDAGLDDRQGDQYRVGIDYPALVNEVYAGNILLLDDGRIQLRVEQIEGTHIATRVLVGGILSNRKGINVLGGGLSAPALTAKDREDILTAHQLEADFVAISFPVAPPISTRPERSFVPPAARQPSSPRSSGQRLSPRSRPWTRSFTPPTSSWWPVAIWGWRSEMPDCPAYRRS